MRTGLSVLLAGAMTVLGEPAAAADVAAPATASKPVFTLITLEADARKRLINGHVVKPSDWPALVTAVVGTTPPSEGSRPIHCSGVLVGPGVMLTAAHCFDPGDESAFRTQALIQVSRGTPLTMTCTLAGEYQASDEFFKAPRVPQDYALCYFKPPAGVTLPPAETLEPRQALAPGDAALMSGWGCRTAVFVNGQWRFADAGSDDLAPGIDDTVIEAIPSTDVQLTHGFVTMLADLTVPGSEPALCSGDSGGALFSGATVAHPTLSRRVRAVNSWVGPAGHRNGVLRSYVAPLSEPAFNVFAVHWLSDNPDAHICGWGDFDSRTAPAGVCRP